MENMFHKFPEIFHENKLRSEKLEPRESHDKAVLD